MRSLDEWMNAGSYLPPALRDFHDQKDVFRTIHDTVDVSGDIVGKVDWIAGQCYVIDIFLWYMARRGYTLQRNRTKLPFRNLETDVKAAINRRDDAFAALLSQPNHRAREE